MLLYSKKFDCCLIIQQFLAFLSKLSSSLVATRVNKQRAFQQHTVLSNSVSSEVRRVLVLTLT